MKIRFTRRTIPAMTALLALCLVPELSAALGTNTGNMDVSAEIQAACTVSASPMAFGIVLPGVVKETQATVTAICTSGTTYTLDLGDGLNHITNNPTGTPYRRQMAGTVDAARKLPYILAVDLTYATEVAATAALAATNNLLTSTVGNALPQDKLVYGRIVGVESAAKGSGIYSDTVVVTISFVQ